MRAIRAAKKSTQEITPFDARLGKAIHTILDTLEPFEPGAQARVIEAVGVALGLMGDE